MLAGRTLTTRFHYGGESALRRRVAPGEGVRRVVAGEELVVSVEGATSVRIHVIRGDWTWEVDVQDAVAVTTDEALALFARLREVDDDTWDAALPPGTVTPASRPGVVAEMLADVPVPEGFDVAAIAGVHATTSRSTVAAEVALGAVCAWAAERAAAIEAADPPRQQAADEAVAGVASWPLLAEAAPGDGWDDVLRDGGPECRQQSTR